MSRVCIIDDDFASEAIVDAFRDSGHEVIRYSSAADALAALEDLLKADYIIVDVMMARPPAFSEISAHGGHRTGLLLAQEVKKRAPTANLVLLSATQDNSVVEWCRGQINTRFISKITLRSPRELMDKLKMPSTQNNAGASVRAFIVHGHDEIVKLELKNYLQNTLKLPEPIILHEQPSQGRTILEKLEAYARDTDLVFVLLTPDDPGANPSDANTDKRRARQNVIFELGYFMARLGRSSGRVVLLHKGPLELPSDISGLIYVDITHGISSAGEMIRRELTGIIP